MWNNSEMQLSNLREEHALPLSTNDYVHAAHFHKKAFPQINNMINLFN